MYVQELMEKYITEGASPKDAFFNVCALAQMSYSHVLPSNPNYREAKRVHKRLWEMAPTYGVTR